LSLDSNISEEELIKQYQLTEDQECLGKLFTPYMELMYGVCLKYLKDSTKAQDAVMDVYVHVGKKLKTHQVEDFRPWLYVVTKNHCFDQLRKASKKLEKEKAAKDMYSTTVFHPDNVSKEALLIKMEACVEKLNKEQKNCIEAFYYKSLSYDLIAKEYGLSWNSVRSYIQNGRRKLKQCLDSK